MPGTSNSWYIWHSICNARAAFWRAGFAAKLDSSSSTRVYLSIASSTFFFSSLHPSFIPHCSLLSSHLFYGDMGHGESADVAARCRSTAAGCRSLCGKNFNAANIFAGTSEKRPTPFSNREVLYFKANFALREMATYLGEILPEFGNKIHEIRLPPKKTAAEWLCQCRSLISSDCRSQKVKYLRLDSVNKSGHI
ncbi:hypothetical protein C8J57DRAFT_1255270 [Mycena rebaudengoi]|nr:hypothetical protein C8J57DRAFT_1255270 [Mycena rebaudengoi]